MTELWCNLPQGRKTEVSPETVGVSCVDLHAVHLVCFCCFTCFLGLAKDSALFCLTVKNVGLGATSPSHWYQSPDHDSQPPKDTFWVTETCLRLLLFDASGIRTAQNANKHDEERICISRCCKDSCNISLRSTIGAKIQYSEQQQWSTRPQQACENLVGKTHRDRKLWERHDSQREWKVTSMFPS